MFHLELLFGLTFLLFGSGMVLVIALNIRENRFLSAVTFSLVTMVATWNAAGLGHPGAAETSIWTIYSLILCFLLVVGLIWRSRKSCRRQTIRCNPQIDWIGHISAPILILIFYAAYYLWAGPYTEIPSDFWKHLARVNAHIINPEPDYAFCGFPAHSCDYWYRTVASLIAGMSIPPLGAMPAVMFVTGVLFLISTYFFSHALFKEAKFSRGSVVFTASLATLLTFLFLGTATFSYVRYYSLAPGIIAFPILYIAIIKLSKLTDCTPASLRRLPQTLLIIGLLTLLAFSIHAQEGYFLVVLTVLFVGVRLARNGFDKFEGSRRSFAILLFSGSLLLMMIAAKLIVFLDSDFSWAPTPHLIDAGRFFQALDGLPIATPGFRIWDTVGGFGLVTLLFAIIRWQDVAKINFFIVGLLIPLVTFFNPPFVYLFLHASDSSVVWRTAYLIPMPILFAYLSVKSFKGTLLSRALTASVSVIILLTFSLGAHRGLLGSELARVSRLPSIIPTDSKSGGAAWADIIKKFIEYDKIHSFNRIISDPITTFVISAAVRGDITSYTNREYFPAGNEEYRADFENSDHSRDILIINRRGLLPSASTQIARHWSPSLLATGTSYPASIDRYLEAMPKHYSLIWENEDVSFYIFQPDRLRADN